MELIKSQRNKTKIKLAIQGPSGSGKTYSSLLLAKGLVNGDFSKVAVIDTEGGSSNLYANLGEFNVLKLSSPHSPEKYIEAIDTCVEKNMHVVIIDSITHEWSYLLNYHSKMKGNSFANWKNVTQRHNLFIEKILQSPIHIIATMRSKQTYVLNFKDGKHIPEKIGLKAVQRNDIDYEFTLVFDLDNQNQALISKDRTGIFTKTSRFKINEHTGRKIEIWCNFNEDLYKQIKTEIEACETLSSLRNLYTKYSALKDEIEPLVINKKLELEKSLSKTN